MKIMPVLDRKSIERDASLVPGDFLICRVQQKLEPLAASPDLWRISGFSPDRHAALMGNDAFNCVLPQDHPVLRQSIARCTENKPDVQSYYRIRHNGPGVVWEHAKLRLLGSLDGAPVILAVITNASLETGIQGMILDNQDSSIYIIEKNTYDLLYVNKTASRLVNNGDYANTVCYSYIHGRDKPCENCPLGQLSQGMPIETEYYDQKIGRYYSIRNEEISWFGREAVVQFADDITDGMAEQHRLAAAAGRLQDSIDDIPAGIAVCRKDSQGLCLIAANRYICTMLGLSLDSILGSTFPFYMGLVHPDDRAEVSAAVEEAFVPGKVRSCTFRIRQNGTQNYRYFYVSNSCFKGSHDELISYVSYKDIDDQMKAEKDLKSSNLRFHLAIENTGISLWEYSIEEHCIRWPDPSLTGHGMSPLVQNVPDSIVYRIDPADRPAFLAMYKAIDRGEPTASCDFWFVPGRNESARCERVTYITSFDKSGKPVKAYGIGTNITGMKLAEEQYAGAVRELMSVSPKSNGAFHLNLSLNRCEDSFGNGAGFMQISAGQSVDDFLGHLSGHIAFSDEKNAFISACSREQLLAEFREGRDSLSFHFRCICRPDELRWETLYITMVQNPRSGDIEALVYAVDTDDLTKNEKIIELLTSLEFDLMALASADTGALEYYAVNPNRTVFLPSEFPEYYSDSTGSCTRYVIREGQSARLLPESVSAIQKALRKRPLLTAPLNEREPGSPPRYKQISISYLSRERRYFLLIMSDITKTYEEEQRRLEELGEALDRAEKASSAKSEFLSNISHDMRTPLNGIIGFTSLALDCPSPSQVRDYLEKIRSSSSFLLALINDTLDLSRIESGRTKLSPALTDSTELLESVITPISAAARQKGVSFVLDRSRAAQGFIWTDRLALQKIILNLLSNAVKFTPPGGRTSLTVEYLDRPAAPALPAPPPAALPPDAGSPAAVTCRIAVCDSGIGIGRDFLPRLYEPFTQERDPLMQNSTGTGLGLSIVKQLVGLMGGSIDVDTEKGRGTRFTVLLPLLLFPDCRSAPQLQTPPPCSALDGALVLVCEDHPMNLEIARTLLEKRGMKVLAAADGKAGLEAFERSAPGNIAAILMDIRMPVMDGLAASRAIRALRRSDAASVPIIAMTANAFDEDIKASRDAGINAHLAKPIDTQLLYSTLERYIGSHSASALPPV